MQSDLLALRECHARMGVLLDRLLAQDKTPDDRKDLDLRRYAGGPLNERGVAEINQRFEAGFRDQEIALALGISLAGVSKRRTIWRRQKGNA